MVARNLCIVGLSHRTAPLEIRERLAFNGPEIGKALGSLKQSAKAVTEAALVSTCNRVEMVAVAADPDAACSEVISFITEQRRLERKLFERFHYRLAGRDAVRHLFRVGASLDSMVVGEPQILGQLKAAYAQAVEAGAVGLILHRAFHKAFSVAKLVRKSTAIGMGGVSVSTAAVKLARQIFDSLKDKTVLMVGAGQMAELTARSLVRLGVESLLVTNRRFERAVKLASEMGGTAVPFEHFRPYLKLADVVIGSAAVSEPLLRPDDLGPVMRERYNRPMFMIDLGVPRNFDPSINALDGVFVYDLDDLGQIAADARYEREQEAQRAEIIVEREVDSFCHWLRSLDLVPTIKAVRSRIEVLRELELKRHRSWLATLAPEDRSRVEALSRGLTNKILHQIVSELRSLGHEADAQFVAAIARRLLGAQGSDASRSSLCLREGGQGDDDPSA